jgi:hypothetical protein
MAGTRNKQMYSNYHIATTEQEKHSLLHINNLFTLPAFPCGVNVQYVPSHCLSSNAVDVESSLYGIGSNNYVFPTDIHSPKATSLSTVQFIPRSTVYIPKLPPYLQGQRP